MQYIDPKMLSRAEQRRRELYDGGDLLDLGPVVSQLTTAQRHELFMRAHKWMLRAASANHSAREREKNATARHVQSPRLRLVQRPQA